MRQRRTNVGVGGAIVRVCLALEELPAILPTV